MNTCACRFSLAAESGATFPPGAWAFHCGGFSGSTGSRRQTSGLEHLGSVAVARGLQRGGSAVAAHGLRCPEASGIF